jgi:hypothetical protein
MRKQSTLFILFLAMSLIFAGAVSAQGAPTVDVAVIDENGTNVTVADEGSEVAVQVTASAHDGGITDPWVEVTVDPSLGLQFEPEKAMMWDGTQYVPNDMTNYPNNAFFFWYEAGQVWVWDINYVWGDMQAGDVTQLIAPAIVNRIGAITTTGDLYGISNQQSIYYDSDNYTFYARAAPSGDNETVPMQETGIPVGLALLGLLSIIGGTLYGKFR